MSRKSKTDELREELVQLAKKAKLGGWNEFVEEINCPTDVAAALITGRPELLRIIQPRDMTKDEVTSLYKLLAVLIETNMTLQQHAQQVAHLVDNWMDGFKVLRSLADQIHMFADFNHALIADEDADEEEKEEVL